MTASSATPRSIAHLTPGHTRGCTTWTVKTAEGGKVFDVVIVGSVGVNPYYQFGQQQGSSGNRRRRRRPLDRWALELPGVMSYGKTREEAFSNAERLAIEVIADRITHGELPSSALSVSFTITDEQMARH
jgi:glyoxylase-like metal-dependent hydrolase (beta-lactamase superfamily II)